METIETLRKKQKGGDTVLAQKIIDTIISLIKQDQCIPDAKTALLVRSAYPAFTLHELRSLHDICEKCLANDFQADTFSLLQALVDDLMAASEEEALLDDDPFVIEGNTQQSVVQHEGLLKHILMKAEGMHIPPLEIFEALQETIKEQHPLDGLRVWTFLEPSFHHFNPTLLDQLLGVLNIGMSGPQYEELHVLHMHLRDLLRDMRRSTLHADLDDL